MPSNGPKTDWRFLLLSLAVVAVIIHGSLYPYSFHSHGEAGAAIRALLDSWKTPPAGFSDLIANVFLYTPLGFSSVLALRSPYRLAVVTTFGLLLCTTMEIAQFFDAGRVTNMSDVYLNTMGTLLGAVAGTALNSRLLDRVRPQTIDVVPIALLLVLLAYRLYPYVPTIDVHKYWHTLNAALLHPSFFPWQVFRYLVLWLTTCYLVCAAWRRRSGFAVLFVVAFVFAAKIVIVGQTLSSSELIGAILAVAIWLVLPARSRFCSAGLFVLLGAMTVLFRLQPFDFQAAIIVPFGWVPFRSVVEGSLEPNLLTSGEKIFLYGSLIWIGARTGLPVWASTAIVALVLLITSFAETHLPGRSAEMTDCVMALLLGAGMAALDHARHVTHQRYGSNAGDRPACRGEGACLLQRPP